MQRHSTRHLPKHLTEAAKAASVGDANALLARVLKLVGHLEALADDAAATNHGPELLEAAKQLRPTLELLGKVTHELAPDSVVTVQVGLLQRIGAKDEDEARAALELVRSVPDAPEQIAATSCRFLAWMVKQYPERAAGVRSAIFGHALLAEEAKEAGRLPDGGRARVERPAALGGC